MNCIIIMPSVFCIRMDCCVNGDVIKFLWKLNYFWNIFRIFNLRTLPTTTLPALLALPQSLPTVLLLLLRKIRFSLSLSFGNSTFSRGTFTHTEKNLQNTHTHTHTQTNKHTHIIEHVQKRYSKNHTEQQDRSRGSRRRTASHDRGEALYDHEEVRRTETSWYWRLWCMEG